MMPRRQVFSRQEDGSRKSSAHLANQQTFFAWLGTGLSFLLFGFVIALMEILVRELGGNTAHRFPFPDDVSTLVGVTLPILGLLLMGEAGFHFWHVRRAIDEERFHPRAWYPVLVTCVTCLIGILVALSLLTTP
jgi:putative membrane protein